MATQNCAGIVTGLLAEAFSQRVNSAFGKVEFDAFDTVHGEEDNAGGKGISCPDHGDQVFERGQIDSAEA